MMGRSNDEFMVEQLRADPELAEELFHVAIEENTKEELLAVISLLRAAGYRVALAPEAQAAPGKSAMVAAGL